MTTWKRTATNPRELRSVANQRSTALDVLVDSRGAHTCPVIPVLRHVHRMTPKWPWALQSKRCPMYDLYPESKISVSLYDQSFSGWGHFGDKCTEWLQTLKPHVPQVHVPHVHILPNVSLALSALITSKMDANFWSVLVLSYRKEYLKQIYQ